VLVLPCCHGARYRADQFREVRIAKLKLDMPPGTAPLDPGLLRGRARFHLNCDFRGCNSKTAKQARQTPSQTSELLSREAAHPGTAEPSVTQSNAATPAATPAVAPTFAPIAPARLLVFGGGVTERGGVFGGVAKGDLPSGIIMSCGFGYAFSSASRPASSSFLSRWHCCSTRDAVAARVGSFGLVSRCRFAAPVGGGRAGAVLSVNLISSHSRSTKLPGRRPATWSQGVVGSTGILVGTV